ncbi:hypothetical protein C4565_00935 [Candidatus Parcubacteria bacterium]|jgi:hypothetical protein|nr:MAG: hypothetical protein C4565_00935 [Candidatus Parcubacteria bacterium]
MPITTILKQHRKHIILGIVLGFVFAAGVLTPNVSHALFGISLSGVVTGVFKLIAYIFNFIAGIFFAIGAWLVKFTLVDLNMYVADPAANPIADIGWRVSRDIANLGFVLLTVIMAFMTIIRVQSYGAKKLLLNLIIAAVVVNFSFVIAGTLIDFSNTLTWFFVGRIDPSGGSSLVPGSGLTEVLANAFGPQKFLLEESDDPLPPDPAQEGGGFFTFGVQVLSSIAGLFFIVFFTLLATIVLLMLAGMFLVRYVALTFLLVLAPLAWLFWVFPGLKSYNAQWWSNFWKYTFFAPAASFFVYLSLVAAENLADPSNRGKLAGIAETLPGPLAQIVQNGTQMIVVAGLMIGAITVAQKMGIEGASLANKAKDGLMKGAKTYGKNKAANIGTRLSRSEWGGKFATKMGLMGKNLKGTGEDMEQKRKKFDTYHKDLKEIRNDKKLSPEEKKELEKSLNDANKDIAGKSRTMMSLKNMTGGLFARKVGSLGQKVGKPIESALAGQASKEIKRGGWADGLLKGAFQGAGIIKEKEKKDEKDKTPEDREKDHEKLLKTLEELKTKGFKISNLKEFNKKFEESQQKTISALRGKWGDMNEGDLSNEYSKLLKQQKEVKTESEKKFVEKKRETMENVIKKNFETPETIQEFESEIKKTRDLADKNAIDGLDPKFYQDRASSLQYKLNGLLGNSPETKRVFDALEEHVSDLEKKRVEKLGELKNTTDPTIVAIDETINRTKEQVSNWKTTLTKGKYNEKNITNRIEAINQEILPKLDEVISGATDNQKEYLNSARKGLEKERDRFSNDLVEMRNKQKKGGKKR